MSDVTKADPYETNPKDPYKIAVEFGLEHGRMEAEFTEELTPAQAYLVERVAYWAAWRAARNAASALLNKADEVGLTPEQFHALTEVAEEWAYD